MGSLNPKISDWHGRKVWIVGASSGIGAALARQLQAAGAQLALSARREEALLEIATADDLLIPMDVADPDTVVIAYAQVTAAWSEIDLVIYCAGVYQPMHAWELDIQVIRQTLDVNLKGIYELLDRILPDYLEQGSGAICILASVAGYTGLPQALAYGPSKAALINLSQILYSELSPRGIGVYLVNPGFVDTRLTQQNKFEMPAMISSETAAKNILTGLAKGKFEIHFPQRFTRWLKLLSRLPDSLRFHLVKKAVSK